MANLLEQASILLTPTAYNDGKMLSVKPNENLSGSELVANGDFSTDSVWVKDANWSIANGKATSTGAGRMFQSIPFLETNIGSKVVVSFDIVDYTSGGVVIQCYGDSSETFTGVGTHTFETVTTNTLNFYINNSGQGNLVGSIDNVSIKVDLSGDFIFTRNSAATRVNAQGLVDSVSENLPRINYEGFSYQDVLGSEQVLNASFSDGLNNWNSGGGATLSVSNNQLTIEADNDFNFYARQSVQGFEVGKKYKIEIDVVGGVTSKMQVNFYGEGSVIDNQPIVIGKQSVIVTVTNGVDGGRFIDISNRNDDGLNDSLIIESVSVKEYLGQEVVPDSGCGSWLLEPQSTNLITNSEDFSNISWVKGRSIISSNVNTSPDGKLNADKFIGSSVIGDKKLVDSISVVSGNKYTLSVFAKKGEFNGICLRHNTVAFPSGNVIFNLDTGLGTVSGVIDSFSSKDYGNGWWKLSVTSTSDATNSCGQELLLVNDGAFVTNGNDVDGIYIWGAQSEQQSFPTSYIPTNGAASTRLRDLSGNSGNTSLINSTEGVLYFEGKMMENAPVSYVSISDGTGSVNNNLNIRFTPSTNTVWWRVQVGGSASVSIIVGLSDMFSNTKLALKWKENDFSLWENGNKISFDTLGSVFPLNTLNTIDLHEANGLSSFNSELKALAVFKTALTDEQLTALTTI